MLARAAVKRNCVRSVAISDLRKILNALDAYYQPLLAENCKSFPIPGEKIAC